MITHIATRDARTRDAHAFADGQVAAVDAPFVVDGEQMTHPGASGASAANVVNCRCAIAFLTPDEYAEATSRTSAAVEMRAVIEEAMRFALDGDAARFLRLVNAVAA
jgi:uncharacterized protein with gpF-like domain